MKSKYIKLSIVLILITSILVPFSIYAETVSGSSPIIGVNITYIGYDGEVVPYQTTVRFDTEQTMWRCTSSHSTMGCQVWESITSSGSDLDEITGTITTNATSTYTYRLYQYEFIFDKTYVGSITFNGNHPGATTTTTYYVNGDRLVLTDINLVTSFTIGSYSLSYAPLEVLNKLRQWNVPIESLPAIYYPLYNNYPEEGIINYNLYTYPIFRVNQNQTLFNFWQLDNREYVFIFLSDGNIDRVSRFNDLFAGSNITVTSVEVLQIVMGSYPLIKVIYTKTNNELVNMKYIGSSSIRYMPIYVGFSNNKLISTDFALNYGLSNQLLDDLHIIAQGTNQSNTAGSNLENSTSSFNSTTSQYQGLENGFNNDFNSSMQNIDPSFSLNNLGSSFLSSATWVTNQFNRITNNNPFGSVLSFSLLLGLALLLIGKVFK